MRDPLVALGSLSEPPPQPSTEDHGVDRIKVMATLQIDAQGYQNIRNLQEERIWNDELGCKLPRGPMAPILLHLIPQLGYSTDLFPSAQKPKPANSWRALFDGSFRRIPLAWGSMHLSMLCTPSACSLGVPVPHLLGLACELEQSILSGPLLSADHSASA